MLFILLWYIGSMFTAGLLEDDNNKHSFLKNLLCIVMWPFLLGVFVEDTLKEKV